MTHIRNILLLLLLAGISCAQAQPIVRINPGTSGACDVISPTAPNIFTIDPQTGNVIVTGSLVLASDHVTPCAGSGGGTTGGNASFATALSANSFQQGLSGAFGYTASNATSCSVSASSGTVNGTGTCPALTLSGGSCNNGATQGTCTGNGTASEPTALAAGINSCSYTLTATCSPGTNITSSANVTVTPQVTVAGCQNLSQIGTGTAGAFWTRLTTTSVQFSDGSRNPSANATSYTAVWSYPGTSVAWPGLNGTNVRPSVPKNTYLAEGFTVPSDNSVTSVNWQPIGTGSGTGASFAISACPGDFGQTGTQLTPYCTAPITSQSGIGVVIGNTQVPGNCTLNPGKVYYLNILSMAALPNASNVSVSSCSGSCTPYDSVTVTTP